MIKKPLLLVSTLLAAGFLLASCQNPDNNLPPGSTSLNANYQNSPTPTSSPATDSATSNSTASSQLSTSQKGSVKTLADFAPITATQATIVTNKGSITFDLYRDKAPIATINFLTLAKQGYYNGIIFHRVVPNFVVQVGDPLTKDPSMQARWGTGGPGYTFADEVSPNDSFDSEGLVAMANAGPNTNGSQIFITLSPQPSLNGHYTIFGKVTAGMDVVKQIQQGDKITSVSFK
jgi:peptidyl-prolyl cis-trans isomerase B (cyclophilin B)